MSFRSSTISVLSSPTESIFASREASRSSTVAIGALVSGLHSTHLALADAGDVAGALAGFVRQGHTAFDQMLTLADDALVDEFFADAPSGDTDWIDAQTRIDWAGDSRDALETYDGYARDNVAWGAAWDIDPTELKVPTLLWYGERESAFSASKTAICTIAMARLDRPGPSWLPNAGLGWPPTVGV